MVPCCAALAAPRPPAMSALLRIPLSAILLVALLLLPWVADPAMAVGPLTAPHD